MALLQVENLQVYYGVIQALKGVSFEVNKGEIVALIGANGAGKTTILHTVTGLVPAKAGSIRFNDVDLLKTPSHKIVSMGMAHVPEGRRIFQELTVYENLQMGAFTRRDKAEVAETLEMVYHRFPRLEERKKQVAGTLSGGEQQMLAVGRALMSKPKVIMMDEPSLGLAPIIVQGIFEIIKEINRQGVTVLLIEQNANMALQTADIGYVLETGRITMTGPGRELMRDERVKKAYLGK
jgi:branched-chain amino acid transport system ATP-binding protein